MELRVDPARGVCVGDRHYPCNLDCSTGAASIELDGGSFKVRPLLWREKMVLARFAHLGGAFLKQQLLHLCLHESASLPLSEPEQEILAELVIWVNNPQAGASGLPLDIFVLSSVTLDVCRAMQLKPADLDSRDAAEVEMLWQAAQSRSEHVETTTEQVTHQQQAMPRDVKAQPQPANEGLRTADWPKTDSDGWTRILVVPAPAGEAAVDGPDETQDATLPFEIKDESRFDSPSTDAAKIFVENLPAETFKQHSLDKSVAERTAPGLSASRVQSASFIAGPESWANVRSLDEDKSPAIKKSSISRFRVLAADTIFAETSGMTARGVALPSRDSGPVETSDHVANSEIMTGAFEMMNEIQPPPTELNPFDSQIEGRNQPGALNQHVHVLYPPSSSSLTNAPLQKSPATGDLPTAHQDSASLPSVLSPAMNEEGARSLLSHTEQEMLFEELCERLDEAATEMGID